MKIGKLVQAYIGEIFGYCEKNPDELLNLMDKKYSKRKFGINLPFCMEIKSIPPAQASGKRARFWTQQQHEVLGKTVMVCSQWYEQDRRNFVDYLTEKKIVSDKEAQKLLSDSASPVHENSQRGDKARSVKRDGGAPLANAQNAFVRYILSNLGNESFSNNDWQKVVRFFGGKCAYCGGAKKLERDHAIPINKRHLGEHRIGNVVPACRDCNAGKGDRDYREFLQGREDEKTRLGKIGEHMRDKNYLPLKDRGDFNQLREVVEMAYTEINPVAKRYIAILNLMLNE
ncbi:MAG: HNH endonuclease signature motif containing protein [Gammaproteobacteria bacterium]|nr:HNH endonuclease signature motif containing protein [Gammaproteobacteria bacterium]